MPPGRAFRIGDAGHARGELDALQQRHDIDAAGLQHRAVGEIDLVHEDGGELVLHRRIRAGQEARAHAPGDRAQTQIEAGGLDLRLLDLLRRQDLAPRPDQPLQHMAGQDPGRMAAKRVITLRRVTEKCFVHLSHAPVIGAACVCVTRPK